MKKLTALLLAVMLVASMVVAVSAESTTTLTTTVPAATYTLNIPADQEIPFGTTEQSIGTVSVSGSSGFAVGKDLEVKVTWSDFKSESLSTQIPFTLKMVGKQVGGASAGSSSEQKMTNGYIMSFRGLSTGKVKQYPGDNISEYDSLSILVNSVDWGKALGGEYTATITFTAEVVAG